MSRGTPLSTQIIFAETQRDKALAVLGEKDDEIARLREAMDQHAEKGDPVDVMNIAAMVAVREMIETPNG